MPYISQERRSVIDREINDLVLKLVGLGATKGDINYTVCRVALESLEPVGGWSYHTLSAAVGALKDAAAEIERRMLGPYEDVCIETNGDLECLKRTE